ncbi:hypothetical protein [Micromonospora humi]|uniref:Lipoprotein n=1 Tax=Micromonospora humi TaxID=745366 RepID=A0A1C5GJI8_9ACTN|nr:hypothetical protein [Micromonospora humi]SCG33933.1 hypothetical protein GA0070213_10181 [Micromonospora humi]
MAQVRSRWASTIIRRALGGLAGIALLTPATGCGNSAAPVREPAAPGSSAASGTPGGPSAGPEQGDRVEVDGRTVLGVAPGLGFPAGSRVDTAFGDPGAATVILTAPPPEQALAHYRTAGPASGYPVRTDTGGTLHLEGKGWTVAVIASSRDTTVTFSHDRPAATSQAPSPDGADVPLTGRDVGVTNLPFNFRLPPGSRLRDLSDTAAGARFTLVAPAPERVLAFYRDYLPAGFFDVTGDRTADGTTIITFDKDDGEWTGTIEATDDGVTVTTVHHR